MEVGEQHTFPARQWSQIYINSSNTLKFKLKNLHYKFTYKWRTFLPNLNFQKKTNIKRKPKCNVYKNYVVITTKINIKKSILKQTFYFIFIFSANKTRQNTSCPDNFSFSKNFRFGKTLSMLCVNWKRLRIRKMLFSCMWKCFGETRENLLYCSSEVHRMNLKKLTNIPRSSQL